MNIKIIEKWSNSQAGKGNGLQRRDLRFESELDLHGRMAKLADAPDLGSGGQP